MISKEFPRNLHNVRFYLVGIKGTGMAALAEILQARGALVTGSDRNEKFYTDAVLKNLGIPFFESFNSDNIGIGIDWVIHSTAYNRDENPELKKALDLNLPILTYPEALGRLSRQSSYCGISGTHGKTTTTAIAGTLVKFAKLPATVLVASEVPTFENRSTLIQGDKYLVAETCEYKRNFLKISPDKIVITNVEPEHLDYFRDLNDIIDAFTAYSLSLPEGGTLIFNVDSPGVKRVLDRLKKRTDIKLIPFGLQADGPYRIEEISIGEGLIRFRLKGFHLVYSIHIPGRHSVYNATAALALVGDIIEAENECKVSKETLAAGIAAFQGTRRRSEILGIAEGILFMDDYAHHPTAIQKTLKGLREFHPSKRIVVDFMPHLYSRTRSFFKEFGRCFGEADRVILHKIYSSARESDSGEVSGKDLFVEVSHQHCDVAYFNEPMDALEYLVNTLEEGDLFITMGAGNNWQMGRYLYQRLMEKEDENR